MIFVTSYVKVLGPTDTWLKSIATGLCGEAEKTDLNIASERPAYLTR